jgi:hypothetical protein
LHIIDPLLPHGIQQQQKNICNVVAEGSKDEKQKYAYKTNKGLHFANGVAGKRETMVAAIYAAVN